jgi:ribosomal protein S27E
MVYIGEVEDQRDGKLMGVTCTGCVEQSTCFSESLATSLCVSKVLSVVGCVI